MCCWDMTPTNWFLTGSIVPPSISVIKTENISSGSCSLDISFVLALDVCVNKFNYTFNILKQGCSKARQPSAFASLGVNKHILENPGQKDVGICDTFRGGKPIVHNQRLG